MIEYLYNPRRAPRALIGRSARVERRRGGAFEGPIVDLGPTGCQVVTPAPLQPGESLEVRLFEGAAASPPLLSGRVVWTASSAPFRSGVQFEAACLDAATLLYARLAAEHPELIDVDSLPERIPVSAWIRPRAREEDAAVLPREQEVLVAIGGGARIADLRERLGDRWEGGVNALFALLARRLVVIEDRPETG